MQKIDFFTAQPLDAEDFERADCLLDGETVKIVVRLSCAYFDAYLLAGESVFADTFNEREPYDALTHVFCVPRDVLREGEPMRFAALDSAEDGDRCVISFTCAQPIPDEAALFASYDNGIRPVQTVREQIAPGVAYSHARCEDKAGKPVQVFLLTVDPKQASFRTGTPDDGYACGSCCATVPEMIDAAERNGSRVLAAVNGDFFDMFGDNHPSGLCVKDGKVVANADSVRPFFGVLSDGTPVIASLDEQPELLAELSHAVGGLQRLLRGGKPCDWAPLEPFGFVRHPRTAVGVRADGTVLLLVVDGRIPDYSNGASLVDLIRLLQRFGAADAVNLDGGGSSIVYTRSADGMRLRSNPADLYRPLDKLIRPCFDCILVTSPQ